MSGTWDKARLIEPTTTNQHQTNSNESLVEKQAADFQARQELFEVETPVRSLNQLIVSEHTRKQLEALLSKVRHHEVLYKEWGLQEIDPHGGRTAINLYGPPGTGKSFCAEAIASEVGVGIIRVSYAEIESKYVGETPKNIKAAFAKAQQANAILFFDEADSILGKRLTNVTQSADHGVNVSRSVMLLELDRFDGVTIFATNLVSNYDPAFVRRILGHVELPLPDMKARQKLWAFHIPSKLPTFPQLFTETEYVQLADASAGLSGGDILNCVITGATHAVQRSASHRRVTLEDLLDAVTSIHKAKQDVGTIPQEQDSEIEQRVISHSEAPPKVQAMYNDARNQKNLNNLS